MEYITLTDVLHYFETGQLFNIKYISCNYTEAKKAKQRGDSITQYAGELIEITNGILNTTKKTKAASNLAPLVYDQRNKKNPHHWTNATRNIFNTDSKQIRKAEIHLITEFQRVGIDPHYIKVIY
jgi:hypothetical protein